uniref:Uncharacterized protein n=2 Tax=Chlamydomonas euryale TaxID=1486919 RepID=A0A7R9YS28_9CHLO|mmetsp:Transcript_14205/g.41343  ORF Transcript_14205/g.41343 Transcript_14205/m.41343 type:complete len:200 (+) Transcript_14205:182-781(+)
MTLGRPERFVAFVEWLLRGRLLIEGPPDKNLLGASHMYHLMLSSGMFAELPTNQPVYVGRLEEIRSNWPHMLRVVGLAERDGPLPPGPDMSLCQHESSGDPHNTTAAAKAALAADSRLLRALCWVLLPDFAVFGYPLPRACAHMGLRRDGWPVTNVTSAAASSSNMYVFESVDGNEAENLAYSELPPAPDERWQVASGM